jgi:hypothetical protein
MWTLTGFADEISPELDEQLDTLVDESIRYAELRSVWNKNMLDLTVEEVEEVGAAMRERGVGVSSVGSPIGKVPIAENFTLHLERFRRALHVPKVLDASYVRVFSFFMPEEDPAVYRDEVLQRMGALAREAEAAEVVLVHENEKNIYGDILSRCLEILTKVDSPALRAVWDAANFVQCGVDRPYEEGYGPSRPSTWSTCTSRTRSPDRARWCPRVRGTARSPKPSLPCAPPGSTASSPSNRTSPPRERTRASADPRCSAEPQGHSRTCSASRRPNGPDCRTPPGRPTRGHPRLFYGRRHHEVGPADAVRTGEIARG